LPSSSDDENYDQEIVENFEDYTGLPKNSGLMGLRGIEEGVSHDSHSDVIQFDPNSITNNTTLSFLPISNSSSFVSISDSSSCDDLLSIDHEDDIKIQLDAAVDAGDWDAVAALAADISCIGSNESGSILSYSQQSLEKDLSFEIDDGRENLRMKDAQRAAKINNLIAREDWDAVAVNAVAGSLGDVSVSSVGSGDWVDNPVFMGKPSPEVGNNKQNFYSKSNSEGYLPTNQVQIKTPSETSSLSNMSPSRNVNPFEFEAHDRYGGLVFGDDHSNGIPSANIDACTTMKALEVISSTYSDSSGEFDNDTKPILSKNITKNDLNDGQNSRSWRDRMLFRKQESKEEPSELALQEDSSGASSWSHSSDEENVAVDPYGDGDTGRQSPMQPEIEAFGSGYGLAAVESAFESENTSKDSANKESDESKDSLRDELDRAIESGDWTAVERQTNRMLESPDDETPQRTIGVSSSSTLLNDDPELQRGWSSGDDDEESKVSSCLSSVDDERIATLERLIETDDWQGIVTVSRIHNQHEDSTMASSSILDTSTMSDFQDTGENTPDLITHDEMWRSITRRADR